MGPQASSALLSLPIVVFGWQVLGAAATFRPMPGQRGASFLAQLISLSFVALLYRRFEVQLNPWLAVLGVIGLAASVVLFEWARRTVRGRLFSYIFSSDTPEFLCAEGPYAYIRNPFYSSYLLALASTALMMPSLFRALVVLAMIVYFTAAAMYEERKFGRSAVATEYEQYKQRTGRFLPRVFATKVRRSQRL
ncbi:MAG TPA: isoprenylcysteine carboxylmethyltransferase family protein [Vicinamibacterales bacterium]|jgi:protein-S-isoprenylcysteine O-methyltransferase Ste14